MIAERLARPMRATVARLWDRANGGLQKEDGDSVSQRKPAQAG
jgi:hypothetical protein